MSFYDMHSKKCTYKQQHPYLFLPPKTLPDKKIVTGKVTGI